MTVKEREQAAAINAACKKLRIPRHTFVHLDLIHKRSERDRYRDLAHNTKRGSFVGVNVEHETHDECCFLEPWAETLVARILCGD